MEESTVIDATAKFQKEFPGLPGALSPRIAQIRKDAFQQFKAQGLPNKRMEAWRNSNIKELKKYLFEFNREPDRTLERKDIQHLGLFNDGVFTMVFLNGYFQGNLSSLDELPAGISLHSIAEVIKQGETPACIDEGVDDELSDGFASLNTAFFTDGSVLKVAEGTQLEQPIHMVFLTAARNHPIINYERNSIVIGEHASCTVLESYYSLGESAYGTNSVTELITEPGSVLNHYRVFSENKKSNHHSILRVRQHENSTYKCMNINGGEQVLRNSMNMKMVGENSECDIKILDITVDHQSSENHVSVQHLSSNCTSKQTYKSILYDESTAVFNGGVYVAKNAQKTDAMQSSNNLLLSPNAEVNTKPQLEIYADDVKCSHGATVGELDEDMVFYLQSRGIEEEVARSILSYGFCREIMTDIANAYVSKMIEATVANKLKHSLSSKVDDRHYQTAG